jgi:hypothetical protein
MYGSMRITAHSIQRSAVGTQPNPFHRKGREGRKVRSKFRISNQPFRPLRPLRLASLAICQLPIASLLPLSRFAALRSVG